MFVNRIMMMTVADIKRASQLEAVKITADVNHIEPAQIIWPICQAMGTH